MDQGLIGWPSTSRPKRKENSLTIMDTLQNITENRFLDKYAWGFNTRKLQSVWSAVCGQYCIFYLSHRVRGHSMNKMVQLFTNNTLLNDTKVSQFVTNNFNVKDSTVNDTNQFCKKLFK